jgi:hypothetical protein
MVDKHSIFSFDPFPRKETPTIFKINGTMIRVQVFLLVQEQGRERYLSLNPQKCMILLKVGIGFQVKIVLLLKIGDFRAGWCIPPAINPF